MGVFIKSFIYVGREFKNEEEAISFFQSKIHMNEDDLDEMGSHLRSWLDKRQDKGFPQSCHYSIFSGDQDLGYYIGYPIYDKNPLKMKMNIEKACRLWKEFFYEEGQIINTVLYT